MCGIFGWVKNNEPHAGSSIAAFKNSLEMLTHRGPDDEGSWLSPSQKILLGHRRLKILDLSDDASQPMVDAQNKYVVIFNGEIYNFKALRVRLEGMGYSFKSTSDTEVLLYLLIHFGVEEGVKLLDGMFGGAFHNIESGEIWIFRDHLGQKPIYYYLGCDEFIFSSELGPLLSVSGINWVLDRDNFFKYLLMGYYALNQTPIVGIKKLLPGTLLKYSSKQAAVSRWWGPSIPLTPKVTDELSIESFENVFDESCALASTCDVSAGIFLSGGIDSTIVASSLKRVGVDFPIFHVSMADREFDESEKVKFVAKHLDIKNVISIEMNEDLTLNGFEELINKIDEPHGDPGFINAFCLSREAKKNISVAIGGDGADELLAGYLPFKALSIVGLASLCPKAIGVTVSTLLNLAPNNQGYINTVFKIKSVLAGCGVKNNEVLHRWLSAIAEMDAKRLMPQNYKNALELPITKELNLSSIMGSDNLNNFLIYYQNVFLPEFVCHHTDRAGMMNGLEIRSPFLTKSMIEYCNSLPANMKIRNGKLKWILKEVLRKRGFPEYFINQKKQGFTLPLARYLKSSLRRHVDILMQNLDLFEGLINEEEVRRLVLAHFSESENNYRIIYNLLMFSCWKKRYPNLRFNNDVNHE